MLRKFFDLFKPAETLREPLDFSVIGTDIHSHFIPGIDDGSPSMEASLTLLHGMEALGYRKVITTPHVMSDVYRNTPDIILSGCDRLREAAHKAGIRLDIECAAEYNMEPELMDKVQKGELLTFGDRYVLFELSFLTEPPNTSEVIFEMQLMGYRPVLAHPERYGYWHMQWEKYEQMTDRGVLLQLNINSISGHYGPEVKKASLRLLAEEKISLLGSDCHHPGHLALLRQASQMEAMHKAIASGKILNLKL